MNQPQQRNAILNSMLQITEDDAGLLWLLGLIGLFFLFCILFHLVQFISGFVSELRLLTMEIKRSEDEDERRYYLCLRRKLWLSLIPFVRY